MKIFLWKCSRRHFHIPGFYPDENVLVRFFYLGLSFYIATVLKISAGHGTWCRHIDMVQRKNDDVQHEVITARYCPLQSTVMSNIIVSFLKKSLLSCFLL